MRNLCEMDAKGLINSRKILPTDYATDWMFIELAGVGVVHRAQKHVLLFIGCVQFFSSPNDLQNHSVHLTHCNFLTHAANR